MHRDRRNTQRQKKHTETEQLNRDVFGGGGTVHPSDAYGVKSGEIAAKAQPQRSVVQRCERPQRAVAYRVRHRVRGRDRDKGRDTDTEAETQRQRQRQRESTPNSCATQPTAHEPSVLPV